MQHIEAAAPDNAQKVKARPLSGGYKRAFAFCTL